MKDKYAMPNGFTEKGHLKKRRKKVRRSSHVEHGEQLAIEEVGKHESTG